MLYMGLDSQGICSVDEDTGVLGGDDGFDDRSEIVDIGESLDAENNIVVSAFARGCFFGGPDNWQSTS